MCPADHVSVHRGLTLICVSQPSPGGLINLGNTCYMNAVIQALYSSSAVRSLVQAHGKGKGPVITALARVFDDLKSGRTTSPSCIRSALGRTQSKFCGYEQQDAEEFLRYLLAAVHEEIRSSISRSSPQPPRDADDAWNQYKRLEESDLVNLIAGQHSSVIECGLCGHRSYCWDPFWELSLPLPRCSQVTIEKCIREFESLETLDHDERPTCEKCKRPVPATKRLTVERPPQLLVIHLKRFNNQGFKLSSPKPVVNQNLFLRRTNYSLLACVSHHGSYANSGHYTAYCCSDSVDRAGSSKSWFHMDDERVTELKNMDLESNLSDAYLLLYGLTGSQF